MRELHPTAKKSRGRDQHRARYAAYIVSPEWFRRREEWEAEERQRLGSDPILCRGGCGTVWGLRRDDLHHCDYDRLGDEAHEDLWAMCRPCHTRLHDLMVSTRSWRKLPLRSANLQAIALIRPAAHTASPAATLRAFL